MIISLNLYLILAMQSIVVFQNMGGLYTIYQSTVVGAAVINLVVSIILGCLFGTVGVFIGTTISYIYQTIRFNRLLHKHLLESSAKDYWIMYFKFAFLTFACFIALYVLNRIIKMTLISELVVNVIFTVIIHTICASIYFFRDKNFLYYIAIMKGLISKKSI